MASRIRFTNAKQVFETYPDLAETVTEPEADADPGAFALELKEGDAPYSALAYFAHLLPKRESVWWGMKCVSGLDTNKSADDHHVLALSEAWVREGDEEARAAVHAAAEATKADSAAVWIGLAAGWSGGSLSPNPDHRVDMPDGLTAKAVNTAVLIALGSLGPQEREEALEACLSAGLTFAKGAAMPPVSIRTPMTFEARI
ncbi:hypothetical protein E1180_21245 [Roseibium denhamense]|uniref:Secreted protein n=1 Tax=Roseibium denhamense TaxID=76305 RepID=A0ABY1NQU5_9HYPH|nr:hypothetical protein [Roseibium denhamense]MTI08030.1 hypothetical protein [Roseibium denhamense]SMP15647.1 hypothetical protein SAMN06265374_1618 [Roseibium denhamense]